MNKRSLHHFKTNLNSFKVRYLIIAITVSLAVAVVSLRQNNLTAIKMREQVLTADKQSGDVETAMRKLRGYVYAHMNTDLASGSAIKPPIQLKYSYERLVAAEKARVSSVNEKVYGDAQVTCEKLFPKGLSGSGRIPCIRDYIAKNGTSEKPIQDSLYKYDFSSPWWSPDLAGFSLLLAAVLFVLLIFRFSLDRWLKKQLHDHM